VLDEIGERLVALQEEERRRIAAELHDSTGQHLVAGGLFLVQLRSLVGDVAGSADVMDQIQTTLREAQKEIRIFTYLLYPPDLRRVGLKETVERFVEGFARRTGIRLRIEVAGSADGAPYELQRSILRIVQEALSNVHRHAQATSVAVTLTAKPDRIQLRVADNGRGFAKANGGPVNSGVGLPGMEARIRQFGGDLKVYSGKRGTLVVATVPIAQRSAVSSPPLSAARSSDLVPARALSWSDAVAR
jgi:signal transduction histidine kinase